MKILTFVFSVLVLLGLLPLEAASLTAGAPLELTGTKGKFDFIKFDEAQRRLVACHTENHSLDVIDADGAKLIKSIDTGAAQGVWVDAKNGRYFVSVSKPPKLVIIDSTKLEVTGEVALPDPADVMTYDPTANRAYVCNDEKPELWVIDPEAKKILSTLKMPGVGMEDVGVSADGGSLFQCLKGTNALVKVDLAAGKVTDTWPTAPVVSPHGLALVDGAGTALLAGGNGKLGLMSLTSGKVLDSADIAQRVDEIAYDPGLQRVYCASGTGAISVVGVGADKLTLIGTVPSAQGAHSVTVDPKTHTVWIVYGKDGKAFAQPFTANSP